MSFSKDEITVILALDHELKPETELIGEILPDKINQHPIGRMYTALWELKLSGYAEIDGINMHSSARWCLTGKGLGKKATLKKHGWYLGY